MRVEAITHESKIGSVELGLALGVLPVIRARPAAYRLRAAPASLARMNDAGSGP
jgi:hypothetical protein